MSTELVTAPYWGLFESDQIDLSTTEKEFTEYRELNVTNTSGLTKFEVETKDKDAFMLLHEGYLEVRYQILQADGVTALGANEDICLQNNALSMFRNVELLCEDQRIEYCDLPYIGHTIKNLSEFSKPHGESIASNQHFFLDSTDYPSTEARGKLVRFFNTNAARFGVELFFQQNNAFQLIPTVAANVAVWQQNDTVVAYLGYYGGPQITFNTYTPPAFRTRTARTVTLTGATGILTLSGGANGDALVLTTPDNVDMVIYNNGVPLATAMLLTANIPIVQNVAGQQIQNNIVYAMSPNKSFYNTGFDKRVSIAGNGLTATTANTPVSAFIPLKNMFLFCNAFNKVTRGLRWRLVLNKESQNQCLFRDPYVIATGAKNPDRNFAIQYISVWIPRLKPNLETLKMLESKLVSNETFDVNFTDMNVFRSGQVIINDAVNSAFLLSTTTKKPIRVWVAFQKKERVDDSQVINKRVFDLLGTTALHVRLNGKIFPLYEYKITYSGTTPTSGINRVYNALLNSGYKMHGHHDSSLIDINSFQNLYPIFYCDLTDQDEDLFKSQKSAEIEVRYSNNAVSNGYAPNGYYIYIVWEAERLIKMKGISGSLALVL